MRRVNNFAKGGNLQNLVLPFASMVRGENKSRVFSFLVFESLEHLPYMFGSHTFYSSADTSS